MESVSKHSSSEFKFKFEIEKIFFSEENIKDGLIFYGYLWIIAFAMNMEAWDPHPISLVMVPAGALLPIYLAYSLRRDGKKIAPRNKLLIYAAILFFVCFGLRFLALRNTY